jgi:hypothetical protein
VGNVTVVEMHLFEMSRGRRLVLLLLATIGAVALGIVLSAAFARPAGAATLPLPSGPTLPVPVGTSGGGTVTDTVTGVLGNASSLPTNVINPATAAASSALPVLPATPGTQLPIAKLPVTGLPRPTLPTLPLPQLPVITMPGGSNLTSGVLPTGTTGGGLAPGTGGPAGGHGVKLSNPAGRRTTAKSLRTGHSSTGKTNGNGTPVRTPAPRIPSPSFPLFPSAGSEASAPGHGSNPWNALPLTIALLALVALGGVFLRRRISLATLFDSRLSPPG